MKNTYALLFMLLVFAVLAPLPALADIWNDQINDPTRFVVLDSYGGAAVLDQETGLVWEQRPQGNCPPCFGLAWLDAQVHCNQSTVGNRLGWRLPTIQELASLIDPTVPPPTLPAGHPFSNVAPVGYWSATTNATFSTSAWLVVFDAARVTASAKTNAFPFWCVRGGQGVNPQ